MTKQAENSSSKDFHGSLKITKPVYTASSISSASFHQHVGNNLLGKGSLQPVASPAERQIKAKGVGPKVFNIDGIHG